MPTLAHLSQGFFRSVLLIAVPVEREKNKTIKEKALTKKRTSFRGVWFPESKNFLRFLLSSSSVNKKEETWEKKREGERKRNKSPLESSRYW
ncbi:hypothetical protein OWV82_005336 [Melia azedarach]|uniref:Uncharacterized protein n=1 Tax=Melia azedarach TaxID=155640 RepID=A0ACC1YTU7_MELAZ|nr:hypothetical protein OWV82_005336 [Melia azedarach]